MRQLVLHYHATNDRPRRGFDSYGTLAMYGRSRAVADTRKYTRLDRNATFVAIWPPADAAVKAH